MFLIICWKKPQRSRTIYQERVGPPISPPKRHNLDHLLCHPLVLYSPLDGLESVETDHWNPTSLTPKIPLLSTSDLTTKKHPLLKQLSSSLNILFRFQTNCFISPCTRNLKQENQSKNDFGTRPDKICFEIIRRVI